MLACGRARITIRHRFLAANSSALPLPETSADVLPVPSLKAQAAIRSGGSGDALLSTVTLKVPLVALTTAAAVLLTSVALRERPPAGSAPSSGPALIENAPVENEQAVLRQFREISLAHRLESDRPSGQPGMYVG